MEYDLKRFLSAQETSYNSALAESAQAENAAIGGGTYSHSLKVWGCRPQLNTTE